MSSNNSRSWVYAHYLAARIAWFPIGPEKHEAVRDFLDAALIVLRGGRQ